MIIFDLDGTLADCEHRRHFVDASYLQGCDHWHSIPNHPIDMCNDCKNRWDRWKPDWKSFYEACDKDTPIESVLDAFIHLTQGEPFNHDVQIWSGRCESVREKTLNWLTNLTGYLEDKGYWDRRLKMRSIGDFTPDDQLKEKWLDEYMFDEECKHKTLQYAVPLNKVEFVFDSCEKSIEMWRRRGIFVFDCNQNPGIEF